MTVSREQQQRIIFSCLNGTRTRDCSQCPAHHNRGGVCCFGKQYEPGAEECSRCRHKLECERLSHSYQPPSRPAWTPGRLPIINQRQPSTIGVRHVTPPNSTSQTQWRPPQTPQPAAPPAAQPPQLQIQPQMMGTHPHLSPAAPRENESYAKYASRVALHGALEGMLTFLLQLLFMRRPF